MLKRCGLALAGLFVFVQLAFASGTIPFSLSQQLDSLGKPLSGGRLYLIQAGTTSTPQNCYQDSALTLAMPNPITLDAAGRIGQFFCADGSIKVRLTDRNGVTQVVADGIQVIGPSGGGGGGSTVDATTVLATGDVKTRYGTGALTGFVRLNGRTIGSATSGATERANADAQALFEYLCSTDLNLVMSGGRGVTCNADWVANKTLTLPDGRGRVLASLDDMGGSAAGRLTSSYFGAGATTLGSSSGAESRAVAQINLPAISPSLTISGTHTHHVEVTTSAISNAVGPLQVVTSVVAGGGSSGASIASAATGDTAVFASPLGSGTPLTTLPPMLLVTNYIKL